MEEKEQKQITKINLPYLAAYGRLSNALGKIIEAATPERFTLDFLSTKLGLKGGSATPIIPLLKRVGFLNSDGTPTDSYNQFRNESARGKAAADALRRGYAPLYEVNEYVHELDDKKLKGVILQVTGLSGETSTVKAIIGTFNVLKGYADFDQQSNDSDNIPQQISETDGDSVQESRRVVSMKLGYTINLNLPATSDISVYDAIFKSLREHLLNE